jgi:signal transduction histidine kinase
MISFATTFTDARQPVLLGAGFTLLVLIGAAALYLVTQADRDTEAIAHTFNVENKLQAVLLNIRRAESAKRGHMLTREAVYLDDYRTTIKTVEPATGELRDLVADNPAQAARIAEIDGLVREKISDMERTLALRAEGREAEAMKLIMSGEGRIAMDRLRALIGEMLDEEQRLLVQRTSASQRTTNLLLTLILAVVALIVAIGGLSVATIQRSNRQRQRAQKEIEATNANLETIVRYRTADLEEANEEIQRFAYIVSHDLRSPLVNIMGFTTELEALRQDIFTEVSNLRDKLTTLTAQVDGVQTPEAEQDVERVETLGKDFDEAIGFIKASITKMDKLINAVLKLSREGRREFKPEYIDMTAMLKTLEKSVTHQAQEADATVTVGDVPPVTSDRLALEQVFSNLLDNAVKYLRRGVPGEIEVSGHATMTQAVYKVRDNGRGIDKTDYQRIFDLFRRAGEQDRPGEGIGLAHVRALVRRLGGTLNVESELGKGSTFTVTLPRRWSAEQRSAA